MTTLFENFKSSLKHWYIPLIIGIVFVLVGIYTFTIPLETYVTLSILFSLSFLFSGISELYFAYANRNTIKGWGWYLVGGIVTVAIGLLMISNPEISMTIIPFYLGFTLLFRALQGLGFAFELRRVKEAKWGNLAISSGLGILLSIYLLAHPMVAGLSLVVLTAITFMVIGTVSIFLSLQLKKIKDFPEKIDKEIKEKIEALQKEIDDKMDEATAKL
ncbi:MAG: DUF308 domain-containing protein [Bacteroidota bacterium]